MSQKETAALITEISANVSKLHTVVARNHEQVRRALVWLGLVQQWEKDPNTMPTFLPAVALKDAIAELNAVLNPNDPASRR